MGTKVKPGAFDCYNNAEPDEPMFVLLARDPVASMLVRTWAHCRAIMGEKDAMIREAFDCADAMDRWRQDHRPHKPRPLWLLTLGEGLDAITGAILRARSDRARKGAE